MVGILLGIFVAPWIVYVVLLSLAPSDPLAAWRNDVVWPGTHVLDLGQPGVLLPAFGVLMVGGVGGVLVAAIVGTPLAALLRRAGLARAAEALPVVMMGVAVVGAYVHLKLVPRLVTTIDPAAHRLTVRPFGAWTRLPEAPTTIERGSLVALDLHARREGYGDRLFVEMYALRNVGGAVLLGARECDDTDTARCLGSSDADLVQLATWLGLAHDGPPDATARPGHHVLRVK
jgi:hypothetical protein